MRPLFYKLDKDRKPVPVRDVREVAAAFDLPADDRVVGRTKIGRFWVSTVFLCVNHGHDDGEPVLFETMVFDSTTGGAIDFGEKDDAQRGSEMLFGVDIFKTRQRYRTWDEAERGHRDAVRLVSSVEAAEPVWEAGTPTPVNGSPGSS